MEEKRILINIGRQFAAGGKGVAVILGERLGIPVYDSELLQKAAEGRNVAMVCSGDPGVYGMASLMYELGQEHPGCDIEIIPGITAANSGAAVLGAPLNHDYCVISLSDLLTPWEKIETRLRMAARGGFAVPAAGIGPVRDNKTNGRITITGGSVDAQGARSCAAIGTDASGSKVIITGGRVDAKSQSTGRNNTKGGNGIAGQTVTISADTAVEGDYVKAIGDSEGNGIYGSNITISGGNIEASVNGKRNGAGICIPDKSSEASITISGRFGLKLCNPIKQLCS